MSSEAAVTEYFYNQLRYAYLVGKILFFPGTKTKNILNAALETAIEIHSVELQLCLRQRQRTVSSNKQFVCIGFFFL